MDFSLVPQIATEYGYDGPDSTFTPENVSKLVQQESAGKNAPPNKYGYAGYFQMKPSEFGKTPEDFAKMSFEDQLRLYAGSYLPKYKYNGTQDLGVMNAAPAFANAPDDKVAYPAGSKEALANPAWVKASNANGAVTVGGIKAWAQAGQAPSTEVAQASPAGPAADALKQTEAQAAPTPQTPTNPFQGFVNPLQATAAQPTPVSYAQPQQPLGIPPQQAPQFPQASPIVQPSPLVNQYMQAQLQQAQPLALATPQQRLARLMQMFS